MFVQIQQQINVGQIPVLVLNELGRGAFGRVYKVSDLRQWSLGLYALKAVECEDSTSVNSVMREVNTLSKVTHQRIVKIFAADCHTLINNNRLFLILTEYCSGGNLNTRLNSSSTPETNLKWISQISEALSYLHSRNPPIVHRDLKADNVLLTDQISEDLKLGDFGLAREYLAMRNSDGSAQSVQSYYMTSGCGPIHWMAPEFFFNHYTEKADVFSLGGIFYAILTRDFIEGPLGSMITRRMYGAFLTYQNMNGKVGFGYAMAAINPNAKLPLIHVPSYDWSTSMLQLIGNMMDYHPHNRPSASQVKASVANIQYSIQARIVPPNWGYLSPVQSSLSPVW